jgi:hypothetical protein
LFIIAKAELFVVFDASFMSRDPAKDALRLAAELPRLQERYRHAVHLTLTTVLSMRRFN